MSFFPPSQVFTAIENTDCLTRQCCGPRRPFELNIFDIYGNNAIALNRPLRCGSCCFPCCLQELEVSAPPGTVVGTVKQNWSCFPSFDIKDVTGTTVLKLKGPFFTVSCCCKDVVFKVKLNIFLIDVVIYARNMRFSKIFSAPFDDWRRNWKNFEEMVGLLEGGVHGCRQFWNRFPG
jgi:Scramblase